MSAVDVALPRLKANEGFRSKPYRDTNGFLTVGYGCNLDVGLTEPAAAALLLAQAQEMHSALSVYGWYQALDPTRQSVCLEIAFNTGIHGLLNFKRMIAALNRHDYASAATECHVEDPLLDNRYAQLAQLLLVGGTQ